MSAPWKREGAGEVPYRQSAAAGQLWPNPTTREALLSGLLPGAAVQVLDVPGRVVLTTITDAAGSARLRLPAGQPAGVYVVRAGSQALRLVVQ